MCNSESPAPFRIEAGKWSGTRGTFDALALFCSCSNDSTRTMGGFVDAYAHAIFSRAVTCCIDMRLLHV